MSCLFNSLSYFLKIDSYTIRQIICDYLEQNKKIIDGLDTQFILNIENNNYIENMRRPNTWGGAIEIQAACNLWNVKIVVYNKRDVNNSIIEFLPITSIYKGTINIEWTGGHYEPIR
jgi:hypothetical protein